MRRFTNRLAGEKSPYLLQHAHNPVDWYPWGEEAFVKARSEDKPVFLSVGYSTCHWCHVMAEESFADPEVAALLNAVFVCVKVDREERPDIDSTYMLVCQMLTGSGGWPLTIVMTPEKKPFFAATYIPRTSRYGRPGLMQLVPHISEQWRARRTEVLRSAEQLVRTLAEQGKASPGTELDQAAQDRAYEALDIGFDAANGGFGSAPKFPMAQNISFLLRYWKRTGRRKALDMAEKTLQAMRSGGIFDQVGFGLHRYSTDAGWLVPHFEKMLYDQALLCIACIDAYLATGKHEYAGIAREVFTYVLRDLSSPLGGFLSAEDADSEGVEGKFYLWTGEELRRTLGSAEADLAIKVFGVSPQGNFSFEIDGVASASNVLYLRQPLPQMASSLGIEEDELRGRLEEVRITLLSRRESRPRPGRDDKVLADWNGLMIAALAKAAQALDEPEYATAAARAAEFVLGHMRDQGGRLLHRFRDSEAAVPAFADDYAFMAWGLLELYEASFDARYLRLALELTGDMAKHFWDDSAGGFFLTADDAEQVLVRHKEFQDGAVPSSNSVAMLNLLRLARLTGDAGLEQMADRIGAAASPGVVRAPSAHAQLMIGLDFALAPRVELVISGSAGAEDTRALLRTLHSRFLPNKVVVYLPSAAGQADIAAISPLARGRPPIDGRATAYVCRNFACQTPVTDPTAMLQQMEGQTYSGS